MPSGGKPPLTATGRSAPLAIALACSLSLPVLLTSCGDEDNPNAVQIGTINADISINPVAGDPVVYLERVDADMDLVTLDVKLRMTTAQEFNAFTLHLHFDPTIVQFAGQMQVAEADGRTFNPFGECASLDTYCGKYPAGACDALPGMTGMCTAPPASIGSTCMQDVDCDLPGTVGPSPCQLPGDANVTGDLFLGLEGSVNGQCDSFDLPGPVDVRLLRLAFNVTTVTNGTRLELISQSQTGTTGDCAILDAMLDDLGIPCDDGVATITGSR